MVSKRSSAVDDFELRKSQLLSSRYLDSVELRVPHLDRSALHDAAMS